MNPKYPVFIPTKGRANTPYTIRSLQKIGVPFRVVVEEQEYAAYLPIVGKENLLVLPHSNQGLVVTRNWIWDYAQSLNTPRFWTLDDNIDEFFRLQENIKYRMRTGTFLTVIEDFADRYENLPVVGMQYEMFAPRKQKILPLTLNTRVYSNMLIQTDARDAGGRPFRNEGFYNDDTDLCLRMLKNGLCIVLFNMFLANKKATMTVKGGMTPHYQGDGRYKMAEELRVKHPDVVTVKYKFNRWQHQVNYKPFAKNTLRLREGIVIPRGANEYGMILITE